MVLPVIVVMALGLIAVGLAVRNELAVELAAREGARAASVSASPGAAATAAATRAVSLPIEVATSSGGETVSVTVTYVDPVDIASSVIARSGHPPADGDDGRRASPVVSRP